MPTLITPRTRFLHVPKTGGVWVTAALERAGIPCERLARPSALMAAEHAALAQTADYADRFTFAFVRHPLPWWRSLWAHRMRTGWHPEHEIDSRARSQDFREFVSLVVERLPGHLNERFCRYVGPPDAEIDFVGRYESLADDLVRALQLAGEDFDEVRIRAQPRLNANDYVAFPARFDPELAERLAESERAIIDRFYADTPIAEFL